MKSENAVQTVWPAAAGGALPGAVGRDVSNPGCAQRGGECPASPNPERAGGGPRERKGAEPRCSGPSHRETPSIFLFRAGWEHLR